MKVINNRHRIVITEEIIDNQRTCPVIDIGYIDNYGNRYVPYYGSRENLGTNQTLFSIDKDGNIYQVLI